MDNISVQKTSFWDFKHKKTYFSRREKDLDVIFGLIWLLFFLFFPWDSFLRFGSYDFIGPVSFLLLYAGSMAYFLRKRKYIATGMVLALMIFLFYVFVISPGPF